MMYPQDPDAIAEVCMHHGMPTPPTVGDLARILPAPTNHSGCDRTDWLYDNIFPKGEKLNTSLDIGAIVGPIKEIHLVQINNQAGIMVRYARGPIAAHCGRTTARERVRPTLLADDVFAFWSAGNFQYQGIYWEPRQTTEPSMGMQQIKVYEDSSPDHTLPQDVSGQWDLVALYEGDFEWTTEDINRCKHIQERNKQLVADKPFDNHNILYYDRPELRNLRLPTPPPPPPKNRR